MKKLLFVLLLVPVVSFGQQNTTESDFRNGYIKGFKKGYCIDDSYCNPPFSIEVPLWGKMGFNTYSDGYSKGVIAGKAKKESTSIIRGGNSSISNKESSPSQGAYENAGLANTSSGGAYQNPTTVIQPNVDRQVGQAAAAAGANIASALIARVKKRNDVIVPLKVELNAFKYIVINSIDPNGGKAVSKGIIKRIKKNLLKQGYTVIVLTEKNESKNDAIPEDLESDPSLALYATVWGKDNFDGLQGDLKLFDYNGNLVHQKTAVGFLSSTVSKQVSSDLISNKFNYNPNAEKYLPVQFTQAEIDYQKQQVESAKDVAMKELKRHKELLEMGVITQEEFDKKAAELKKIILGN